ncbi:MAG TPA: hypothetical protein VJ417_02750, partial [Candidatus Glassbacteria bacterium]|nr:hypothetical protein [Candidatus Glassbacteria bacterium]
MTHRQNFFALFDNPNEHYVPFFPDITDWYMSARIDPGEPYPYSPGQFIPADSQIHQRRGRMPAELAELDFLGFYKKFDWGLPVHIYDWFRFEYEAPVSFEERVEGNRKLRRFITPGGTLERLDLLSGDGSWAPKEHFVKRLEDLELMKTVVERTTFAPQFDRAQAVLDAIGERGVGDLPVMRSPFGKLVHEYMGFEQVVYALFDNPQVIHDFLAFQREKDLEHVRLAAACPGR